MLSKVLVIGLVALAFTGALGTRGVSVEFCGSEYAREPVVAVEPVKVSLRLLKTLPEKWELEVTVENVSSRSVFVMSDPTTVDGSRRPYVSLGDEHSLEIGVRVYPPPHYFVDPHDARVRLESLPPGASRKEVFSVSLPLVETMPPYGDKIKRAQIDPTQLQFIRASVGILPDDEGIKDLLARTPFGPWVNGVEQLRQGENKGKRIIELQTVYSSPNISL